MNRPFSAPKGHAVTAQGDALGKCPTTSLSPERASRFAGPRMIQRGMFRPFRAGQRFGRVPRAWPRAVTLRPVGARVPANLHQSRTLATLRDTLLPKLLSGELATQTVYA